MTTLVTQSFGKESEYRRAIFAIWSFWAYNGKKPVLLFTDNPDFFIPYCKGFPIEFSELTKAKINKMRGKIDFLHRMKIALIEEAIEKTKANILYVDSDTFFRSNADEMFEQMAPGRSFMHLREFRFEEKKDFPLPAGETYQAFYKLIESSSFKTQIDSNLKVSPDWISWNAGVIALHANDAHLIQSVYELTEQFFPPTKNHASEQFAFSIVLQLKNEILPCDDIVYHYWYRVKKQIMDDFLSKRLNKDWLNIEEQDKIQDILNWTGILPKTFENHVWMTRDNAIQAFNSGNHILGYRETFLAFFKSPMSIKFLKDVAYHTKRLIVG